MADPRDTQDPLDALIEAQLAKQAGTATKSYAAIPEQILQLVPAQTGDALQDALNLQAALNAGLRGTGFSDQQRDAMLSAYEKVSDDVARLTNEVYQWNKQQQEAADKAAAAEAKANQPEAISATSATPYILTRMPDGSLKQEPNPNYRPPAAPQGPAFSGTAAGMQMASDLRAKEAERAAKSKYDNDVALIIKQMELGITTSAEADNALKIALEQAKANIQTARDQATWERELPFKQAAEQRAQAGERRAGQQMQLQKDTQTISALRGQAEQGQQFVGQLTQAGIAPSLGSMRVAMDPWQSIWGIINRMQESGEITPEMVPVPSAPQAPTAPGVQAPIAPGATAPRAPIPGGF